MYSPYVFALGQLIGEIPYSILCGILYWVLMVCIWDIFDQGQISWELYEGLPHGLWTRKRRDQWNSLSVTRHHLHVAIWRKSGSNGSRFVTKRSSKVLFIFPMPSNAVLLGGCFIQSFHWSCSLNILWREHTVCHDEWILEVMAVSAKSLYPYSCGHGFDGTSVSILSILGGIPCYILLSSGLVVKCKPDEFVVFNPPTNQTCSTWAQDFVDVFGGYIANPSASSNCQYCQFAVGDQFFEPLNISFSNRWRDAFIIFAFFGESPLVSLIFLTLIFPSPVFNLIVTTSKLIKFEPLGCVVHMLIWRL